MILKNSTLANTKELFIPFHLADPAGILFFAHALTLAHQLFEQFVMEDLNCPWKDWFDNPNFVVPIKETNAKFLAPLKAGQPCQVSLSIKNISNSSFTYAADFFQEVPCCEVRAVHVFCSRSPLHSIPIPDHFRSLLNNYIVN